MARHKNASWNLPETELDWRSHVQTALLMDIRDSLNEIVLTQRVLLNRLNCSETLEIPSTLRRLEINTRALNQINENTRKPAKRRRRLA